MEPTTYDDDQMAQAVIDLQKIAGITEPVERAIRNSKGFAKWERESTQAAHRIVCDGKFGTEIAEYRKAQSEAKTEGSQP